MVDEYGNPIDAASGAPLTPFFANSALPAQYGLQRIKLTSLTASQGWTRDVFNLSLYREERVPVGSPANTAGVPTIYTGATQGVFGSIGWSHEWSEAISSFAAFQYGTTGTQMSGRSSTSNIATAASSFIYRINPSLSAILQYRLTYRKDPAPNGTAIQNLILIGLRQTF